MVWIRGRSGRWRMVATTIEINERCYIGTPCRRAGHTLRYVKTGACVICDRESAKAQRRADPEAARAYARQYRAKAPRKARLRTDEVRAQERARRRRQVERRRAEREAYLMVNAEKISEEKRAKREAQQTRKREYMRRWRKENPIKARVQSRNKKARRRAAPGAHTAADIRRMYRQQKGKCLNCGVSLRDGYHIDHIMPLIRGGSNGPENLQLLCPTCNMSKKDKCPVEWAQENGRLL